MLKYDTIHIEYVTNWELSISVGDATMIQIDSVICHWIWLNININPLNNIP